VPTVCGYLARPGVSVAIRDNAPGCNSSQEVSIICSGGLPVVWSAPLTARPQGKAIDLTWEVSSQQDNDYYAIERSTDGVFFSTIGEVLESDGRDNAVDYSFTDQAPFAGANYYRIRQVDFGGQSSFSNIALAHMLAEEKIQVYPNPVKNVLQLSGGYSPELVVKIRNIFGQVIYQRETVDENIDLSGHPPGLYSIEVEGHAPVKIILAGD
jgi:hypothetical protein